MASLTLASSTLLLTGLTATSLYLAKKKHLRGKHAKLWASPLLNPNLHKLPPTPCRLCHGEGLIPCQLCNQTGVLARGGFARRNTVRIASLVGTKWTSVSAIDGKWRHFLCVEKKGRNASNGVAILSSTCGPVQNRIRVEVPVKELKNREIWEGGWTTLSEIRGGGGPPATICTACRGDKAVMCPRCSGLGQVGL